MCIHQTYSFICDLEHAAVCDDWLGADVEGADAQDVEDGFGKMNNPTCANVCDASIVGSEQVRGGGRGETVKELGKEGKRE